MISLIRNLRYERMLKKMQKPQARIVVANRNRFLVSTPMIKYAEPKTNELMHKNIFWVVKERERVWYWPHAFFEIM